ncbi:hypothetical protein VNI00_013193 [Paramarasmius palmivorus]|uniref:Uncharacterized protein n=1 Tax=Paramarasmius palmivorus TaxID=297713 RepID=A0AAW0C1S0_9AGAR
MKSNSAMDILLAQLVVAIGSKLLCVPLYVANTRLAMVGQCPTRYVGGELEQASRRRWDVQEAEESGVPMYCREEEDPIVYRGDRNIAEPYMGLVHCLGTIVREEGLHTLFRGWLLSLARLFIYA